MKKEFNRNDLAAIKRAAASIAPLAAKRDKIIAKRMALQKDLDDVQSRINLFNIPIKEMTGYNAEELVERKQDGALVLKYPETIVPPSPIEEPVNMAELNIEKEADDNNNDIFPY